MNVNILKEMFQLQEKLNKNTNGKEWKNGLTNKGKVINWERAIYLEVAEAIESFPFKHWKSIEQQPDWDNLEIELVDIWHFLMSLLLELDFTNYEEIKKLFQLGYDKTEVLDINKTWKLEEHQKINEVVKELETLMTITLYLNKNKKLLDNTNLINVISDLIVAFSSNLRYYNISYNTLYKKYIGKNVLNQFRQDNGYLEGSYIKVWNGEEDNVVMTRLLNEENLSFDTLYNNLKIKYEELDK